MSAYLEFASRNFISNKNKNSQLSLYAYTVIELYSWEERIKLTCDAVLGRQLLLHLCETDSLITEPKLLVLLQGICSESDLRWQTEIKADKSS